MESETLQRMLRYGLATAMERIHLRPGHRPLAEGLGGPRELGYRQLSGDDTSAVAGHFLAAAQVSERLRESSADAAREVFLFMELRGGGLAEASFEVCRGGLAVTIELFQPLPRGQAAEVLEP
jgi:hypothetical protein